MSSDEQALGAVLDRFRKARQEGREGISWPVRQILKCIDGSLFEPDLSVAGVRERCKLRDHNVALRFRAEVGVPIKRYIREQRLDAAKALLEEGSFRVEEVATAVGFRYVHTFRTAFKQRYGVTPAQARTGERLKRTVPGARDFSPQQWRTLEAAMDRILPSTGTPGAREAGAIRYAEWLIGQPAFHASRATLLTGLGVLDSLGGGDFAARSDAERDEVLRRVLEIPHATVQRFFVLLVRLTLGGFLCDPRYGGNRDGVGWRYIGFEPLAFARGVEGDARSAG